ncbi:hypothetical protein CR513_07340, partial [Mucuna pruriens]
TRIHVEFHHQHHGSGGKKLFSVSNFDQINLVFEKDSCAGNYYQIMNKSISLLEFGNLVAKILKPRQNMHEREEDADDEKGKLVSSRQMNSSSVEEDSRISMKHFPTKRRTTEIMGRGASWWATFTFSLCLFSLKLSKPVLQPQGPNSLWLAIVGMFSFTLFVCAASLMLLVGARFSQMQITVMLISFFALLLP